MTIEGGTLHRFTGRSGVVLCRLADQTDVDHQCVACPLPHNSNNAACWGASKAGPAPAVLRASPGHLYDVVTGKYIGRFEFDVTQSWPRSRFTKGVITLHPTQ